jgi:putative protein-disulfide isomerase
MTTTLFYVADPMCSWCWGFDPVIQAVRQRLAADVAWRPVMGGLARDSDEPMPSNMRDDIRHHWRSVAERTGACFNWDFWSACEPRRSTYPACRAVLAAARQDAGESRQMGDSMFRAVQRAYYTEARNTSLADTLVELAGEIGLDRQTFTEALRSDAVEAELQADFDQRRRLQATAFPSLVLERGSACTWIARGYTDEQTVLNRLAEASALIQVDAHHSVSQATAGA